MMERERISWNVTEVVIVNVEVGQLAYYSRAYLR